MGCRNSNFHGARVLEFGVLGYLRRIIAIDTAARVFSIDLSELLGGIRDVSTRGIGLANLISQAIWR